MRAVQQRPLGRSGLEISEVIIGCGTIGGIGSARETLGNGLSDDEALTMLDTAAALGVTALDTANSYAAGHSERVVGRWLAAHDGRMLVATKVGAPVEVSQERIDNSHDHVLRQIDSSLERMGLDHVDLYLSHAPDEDTPIEETLTAFAELLQSGKVRAIGGCNLSVVQVEAMLDASERHGLPRYEWVQNEYSLLARVDEGGVMPLCRASGLGYTPHSTLCGGILAGGYSAGRPPPADTRVALRPAPYAEYLSAAILDGVQRFAEAAARRGVSTAALAHAWVMSHPDVTAPLVAPRRAGQFDAIKEALTISLDDGERAELAHLVDG
jgi:aryl-alcohol dehydrogenase-like predicted oxidoreductase